jgi:hypothetical protein
VALVSVFNFVSKKIGPGTKFNDRLFSPLPVPHPDGSSPNLNYAEFCF